MANAFLVLPVPAGAGVGAWVDVSTMGPERTISVDGGAFDGVLVIEGSNDAQASAAPASAGPFDRPTAAPQIFVQAWNFLRVRRLSGSVGVPTVTLAGPAAITNVYGSVAVPASDGVGAATDISGGGDINTFTCMGAFGGQILIETSTDGVNFSPTLLFDTPGTIGFTLAGVLSAVRVRRRGQGGAPLVSVGSQATAGATGGAFPGFGAAPPAVAAASSAGALGTASRADHTHAGTSSVNGATGAATFTSPGGTVTIAGAAPALTFDVTTPFGGFGGAPPAIAGASSAGAAGTASRSNHTHALDLVAYNPSLAGMQGGGLIQQTYAAPTATPSVLTMVAAQIPIGAAAGGTLTQSANLSFATASNHLQVGTGADAAHNGAILVNATLAASGISIGGGTSAGVYVADPLAGGAANIAVDDYFFGQRLIGFSASALQDLQVGVGAGKVFHVQYAMDRLGGGNDALTVNGTTGAIAAVRVFGVSSQVGAVSQILTDTTGDVLLGTAAPVVAATVGFPRIPTVAGHPTGAPTSALGGTPLVFDSAHTALRAYNGGAGWEEFPAFLEVGAAPGAGIMVTTNIPAGFNTTPKYWAFTSKLGTSVAIQYFTNP